MNKRLTKFPMPKNVEKRKRKTEARCNGIYLKKLVGSEIIEKSLKVNQRLNISFNNNFIEYTPSQNRYRNWQQL